MERMQNLGKHLGFQEDAKILWLGFGSLGCQWGFGFFHYVCRFFMKGGWEVFCLELVLLIFLINVDG